MVMTYDQEVSFENLKHEHRKEILDIEHKNTMEELNKMAITGVTLPQMRHPERFPR